MKKISIYIIILCLGITSIMAQVGDREEYRKTRKEFYENLSKTQKAQLDYQKELRKEHKKSFRATFTEEQLSIMRNEDLSRKGKIKALKPTLSDAQKELRKSHKEIMKKEKNKFKTSLTNKQLVQFEYIEKKRSKKGGKKKRKRR
ncbi:hypothetical protein AB832_01205 [Flavobacteriaceae bacterium (ex Bugula neritina AB1)]|nr:hypothetical protein AB832_01205 [Flavobacteriaceae bacterium (ex Bugula neritina AB1)]